MQRTEVLEAEEFFSKGQKGSSPCRTSATRC
jgi:adenylosuccinate lyase